MKKYPGKPNICDNIPKENACIKQVKNHIKKGRIKTSHCFICDYFKNGLARKINFL